MAASLRMIADRMDPVRPSYRLGGTTAELGEYWLEEEGRQWIRNARVRDQLREQPNRRLLGLAHKRDKGIAQQHRGLEVPSLRELTRRHDQGTWLRLLYYNTYLIHAPHVFSAPDRSERRHEIGRALASSDYDVAGLVEVFRDPEKDAIKSKFGDRRLEGVNGPAARWEGISSGLWTLLMGDRVQRRESGRRAFAEQGTGLFDSEERANKGMSYVEIGVDDGMAVDFFLTHLHAEHEPTRHKQVRELAAWIAEKHKSTNVAVLAGDFNVGFNHDECEDLYRVMASLNLYDASLTCGGLAAATAWKTSDPRIEEGPGGRTRTEWFEPAQEICRFDSEAPDRRYCDDYHDPATGLQLAARDAVPGNRIDYVFVEEPMPAHAFTLDVARIRRRHFWRGDGYPADAHKRRVSFGVDGGLGVIPTIETPHYMSDHLGLEFECLASPVVR